MPLKRVESCHYNSVVNLNICIGNHPLHNFASWGSHLLVSFLILLGNVPILDPLVWIVSPWLLHTLMARLVHAVNVLFMHHLIPLWHGGNKLFSPASWTLLICFCPTTSGHCLSSQYAAHAPLLWHGGHKFSSPAYWTLLLCFCSTTSGHCLSNVLAPELSMVFPPPVWPHSQARLRNTNSNSFLT